MNVSAINELMMANPASFFILGLVVGLCLRGLLASIFSLQLRSKKASRYHPRRSEAATKRSATVVEFKEPAMDWSENVVKNIAERSNRYGAAATANQAAKNLQQVVE